MLMMHAAVGDDVARLRGGRMHERSPSPSCHEDTPAPHAAAPFAHACSASDAHSQRSHTRSVSDDMDSSDTSATSSGGDDSSPESTRDPAPNHPLAAGTKPNKKSDLAELMLLSALRNANNSHGPGPLSVSSANTTHVSGSSVNSQNTPTATTATQDVVAKPLQLPSPVTIPSTSAAMEATINSPTALAAGGGAVRSRETTPQPAPTQTYRSISTLQRSLFGEVKLAMDLRYQRYVVIKISHQQLLQPVQLDTALRTPEGANEPAHSALRSRGGVLVLEDVRREARILKMVVGEEFPTEFLHPFSCGLSSQFVNTIADNTAMSNSANNSHDERAHALLASLHHGRQSISDLYSEVETSSFHYLVTEYFSGGDLYTVLSGQPDFKVHEGIARTWFRQLCSAVRVLHAHSIAHLDLSLENLCLDQNAELHLIDFGLASQHPRYESAKSAPQQSGVLANVSPFIRLLEDGALPCNCSVCRKDTQELGRTVARDRQACAQRGVQPQDLKFLCRPVCRQVHPPGKLGLLSPEQFSHEAWDGFKQDIFALGVILYSLLTGRPPFNRPSADEDVWFRVIYNGQWLRPDVRSQGPAAVYNGLSPAALDLIDRMLSPQHMRPTVDEIMNHPFFDENHPSCMDPASYANQPFQADANLAVTNPPQPATTTSSNVNNEHAAGKYGPGAGSSMMQNAYEHSRAEAVQPSPQAQAQQMPARRKSF